MEALEQKILTEGQVLPGNILKVGSFLNQQIDTPFTLELGKEIANRFRDRAFLCRCGLSWRAHRVCQEE